MGAWAPRATLGLILATAACAALDGLSGGPADSGVVDAGLDGTSDVANEASCDPATADLRGDPNNCGACGVTCGVGASCLAGVCRCGTGGGRCERSKPADCVRSPCAGEIVGECHGYSCKNRLTLAVVGDVQQLVIDDTSVYFADRGDGTDAGGSGAGLIAKVPLGGGTVTPIASALGPRGIAVDALNVYWTDTGAGAVDYCPIAGCAGSPTQLFALEKSSPVSVAAHAPLVFWSDITGMFRSCPVQKCSNPTATPAGGVGRIVTTPIAAVYTSNVRGAVAAQPYDGGPPRDLVSGEIQPFAIAVAAQRIFWVSINAIKEAQLVDGGGDAGDSGLNAQVVTPGTFGDGSNHPTALAADESSIYWTAPNGIFRCPLAGCSGAPELVSLTPAAWGLATDAAHVYFAGTGAVYRLDK